MAADLTFIRQEEKLARDVYLTLFERWGATSFSSIAQSEQQHMDVMQGLLATYGVADPVADAGRGVFVDPMLQGLWSRSSSPTATGRRGTSSRPSGTSPRQPRTP